MDLLPPSNQPAAGNPLASAGSPCPTCATWGLVGRAGVGWLRRSKHLACFLPHAAMHAHAWVNILQFKITKAFPRFYRAQAVYNYSMQRGMSLVVVLRRVVSEAEGPA